MTRIIDDALVETAARALLGGIDTGDGGTPEQRAVLQAFVTDYWERPDLDLVALEPLDPAATAAAFPEAAQRRRVREFMVLLEQCRHPQTADQEDFSYERVVRLLRFVRGEPASGFVEGFRLLAECECLRLGRQTQSGTACTQS